MRANIHPTYNPQATITCNSCGTVHQAGSTSEHLNVEICSHCHPFYTGKSEQLVDTFDIIKKYAARTAAADLDKVIKKRKKLETRKSSTVKEISAGKALTLKDMMKQYSK